MEMSAPPQFPPMSSDYTAGHAERVRNLSRMAITPAVREHLADVAREYEHLAEEAEVGNRACGNCWD